MYFKRKGIHSDYKD